MTESPSTDPAAAPRDGPALDSASVDPSEIAKFQALADGWWDPNGKMRPLHRLNPVRLAYIRDRVAAHFGRDPKADRPLAGLRLLDIGCGGGLLSEPMARLGAIVVGVDAAERSIAIARHHAGISGLEIDYRATTAEALAEAGERFDIVLNTEVIEHVADPETFLGTTLELLNPGGAMVLSTINRTAKAFALAIVGAEYLLGWLPRGTHDWRRFLRPSEIATILRKRGARFSDLVGVSYNPIADQWRIGRDLDVNYMAFIPAPARHG
ncbi:MAG: bifunctional 2-polyprenyl-6-hydroxyphenol methylase/3-demethylubiquinol 3-O-methyltransferase UbiG [Dongiaceae bacterium]